MSTKAMVSAIADETSAALKRVIEPYNGSMEVTLAFGLLLLHFAIKMLSLHLPKEAVAIQLRAAAAQHERDTP